MGKTLREKAIMAMLGMAVLYAFKDAMDEMADGEDGEGERIFGAVDLNGPNASKGGYRFDLDCQYKTGDEDE